MITAIAAATRAAVPFMPSSSERRWPSAAIVGRLNRVVSGKSAVTLRYLAGSVCAEGVECDFQLVWCDGEMPPPCA